MNKYEPPATPELTEVILTHTLGWNGQGSCRELNRFWSELRVSLLSINQFPPIPSCPNELRTHRASLSVHKNSKLQWMPESQRHSLAINLLFVRKNFFLNNNAEQNHGLSSPHGASGESTVALWKSYLLLSYVFLSRGYHREAFGEGITYNIPYCLTSSFMILFQY